MPGNDANTIFLLPSDTDDESVLFEDTAQGGNAPHDIAVTGEVHHETDQAKFGATSIYFDGTGDYLTLDDDPDWDTLFGSGNFSLDWQVYHTENVGSYEVYINRYQQTGGAKYSVLILRNDAGK